MSKDYVDLQQKYLIPTYVNRNLSLVRGKGMYLFDDKGKKYLDFTSGVGVSILGHKHPVITKAISEQAEMLVTLHSSFANDKRAQAAELLIKMAPEGLERIYFGSSGSEAVEAALKFAVLATGRSKFLHAKGSYHGKTLGSLSVMGNSKYREDFENLLGIDCISIDFNNVDALKKNMSNNVAGVILEPIQGEGGVRAPDRDYLTQVRKICNEYGVLLILDEIQSGMGRTGKFLASEHFDVVPDILCLGKGLAGGIPISATVVSNEVSSKIKLGSHSSTFGGNPLSCAVLISVLKYIKKKHLFDHVTNVGNYFIEGLKDLESPIIKEVRGMGLMIGVEIQGNVTKYLRKMQNLGLLALPSGSNVIRFLPPYIVEIKHINEALRILKKVLAPTLPSERA